MSCDPMQGSCTRWELTPSPAQIQQFCDETRGTYTSWGGHTGGFCRIASLDLVIAHWFL